MSVGRGKSLLLGPALQPDGSRTMAYRALKALVCGQCGAEIAVGRIFARHSRHLRAATGYLSSAPVCAICRPLRVESATEAPARVPTDEERHEG